MSHSSALNKNLIMRRVAKHQSNQSQVQAASSTSPTTRTGPHGSDAQASSTLSYACALKTGPNQVRAMTQTPTAHPTALSTISVDKMDVARRVTRSPPSHHNALTPISTLPPELLAKVFRFYACENPPLSSDLHRLGWIAVTHVCQRWRQVALDESFLWSWVTGSSPSAKWIAEMLARARNMPLIIDLEDIRNPEILAMIPQRLSHTHELRLRGLSFLQSDGVQDICGSEAPELEDFELGSSLASPILFRQFAGTTLFNGQTPKLRTLSLSQVSVPWSLIPRGQLTRLNVTLSKRRTTADLSSPDDLNQLTNFLINNPQLEVLVLESCLPAMLSLVPHGQPIHLPRLSCLCLGGPTSRVSNLLKRLTLPSFTTLRLLCISEPSLTRDDHLVFPPISAHFHNSASVEFKSFKVTANCVEHLLEVTAFTSPLRPTFYDPHAIEGDLDGDPELFVSFDGWDEFGTSNQTATLRQLCSMLPISNIEFLSISALDTIPFVNWCNLFRHCTKVTTLQARGEGTNGMLQSIGPPIPTNTQTGGKEKERKGKRDNRATLIQVQTIKNAAGGACTTTATHIPFPNLTSLFLQSLDFSAEVPYSGILIDVLMNALRRRTMIKAPVSTLTIDHCTITTNWANSLANHVRELCWDGNEGLGYFG